MYGSKVTTCRMDHEMAVMLQGDAACSPAEQMTGFKTQARPDQPL